MRILNLAILYLLLCGMLAFGDVSTANIWVNTSAGPAPSRSSSLIAYDSTHAYGSMQAALTAAQAGDVIGVKNGTYGNQSLSSGKASMVTFICETWQQCLVSGLSPNATNITISGITGTGGFNTRPNVSFNTNGPIVLDGFQGRAVNISASHITIKNGDWCNGTPASGYEEDCFHVGGTPDDLKFIGNVFHDWHSSYDTTYHNDMFQFYPNASNVTFDGNKFYNGPTSNIMTGSDNGDKTLLNWTIQNNYFGTPYNGGNNVVFGRATPCGPLIWRNNTDDTSNAINTGNDGSNGGACGSLTINISNNIYRGNLWTWVFPGAGTITGGNNVFEQGAAATVGSNPKRCTVSWLNGVPSAANGYDIRLASTDTCAKDAGTATSYAPTDMFGTARPQGSAPDVGAYEYASGPVAPLVTTASLPTGMVGSAYSATLTATGTPQITWSVVVGSLPAWASLDQNTGAITGTPNAAGTTNFTVRAHNAAGNSDKALSIIINIATTAPVITTTSPLPGGITNSPYNLTFAASGSDPKTWTATGVPSGLALATTGVLSGTPTSVGTYTLVVTVANGTLPNNTANFSLTISNPVVGYDSAPKGKVVSVGKVGIY